MPPAASPSLHYPLDDSLIEIDQGGDVVAYVVTDHKRPTPLQDDIDREERYRAPEPAGLEDIVEHLMDLSCCDYDVSANEVYRVGEAQSSGSRPKSSLRTKSSSTSSTSASGKTVGFKDVSISQFPMTLGHHPSATSGPPVMLDWSSSKRRDTRLDLDSYERGRQPRRSRKQLRLSLSQRHKILCHQQKFSFEQVKDAWIEALAIRKQRQETLERNPALVKLDEAWESLCRKTSRAMECGGESYLTGWY